MMQNVACLRWSGAHVSIPRSSRGHRQSGGIFFSQSFLIYGIWKFYGHCEMGGTLVPMHIRISSIISKLQTCFLRVTPSTEILPDIYSDILAGIYLTYILAFYLTHILTFYLYSIPSDIYFDILSGIRSGIYSDILSGILSDISSGILSDILCDILPSQLRSRSAHWDLALAVEVQQCPLSRGWGPAVPTDSGWGPAVPTEIGRSQFRA